MKTKLVSEELDFLKQQTTLNPRHLLHPIATSHVARRIIRDPPLPRGRIQARLPRHSSRCVVIPVRGLFRCLVTPRPPPPLFPWFRHFAPRPSFPDLPILSLPESRVSCVPVRARAHTAGPTALFTGLVQGTAEVVSFDNVGDFARLRLRFPENTLDGIKIGASVSCNGACLTVTTVEADEPSIACFDLIVETLRATNLGELVPGSAVNYERSAKVGDEIGGHCVSGHVHAKAVICEQEDSENNRRVVFEIDEKWSKYILPKGFVAVDGCSLTVGETSPGRFNVWLIPETIRQTVFAGKTVGSTVNIEIEAQTQTIVDTIERVLETREKEKMSQDMQKKDRKDLEKAAKKAAKAMEKEGESEEEKESRKKEKRDKKMKEKEEKESFRDDD